jgi:hypothetical protein
MGRTGAINAQVRGTKSWWNFFHNKRIRSSLLDHKLIFWGFSDHFFTARNMVQRAEVVQVMHKFVPLSYIGIFRNEHTQSDPLDSKLLFSGVFECFVTA